MSRPRPSAAPGVGMSSPSPPAALPSPPRLVSLVICTRDRVDALRRTLDTVDALEASPGVATEVVVVDNGSTDGTGAFLADVGSRLRLPVRVVVEPEPGLGRARNAGLRAAVGDVVWFTDDDCLLAPESLRRLVAGFAVAPIGFASGRVLPAGESEAPAAIQDDRRPAPVSPSRAVRPGQLQGANFAVTALAARRVGGFDPRLGAGTPFRCEDIDVVARMLSVGIHGMHLPDVVVWHAHGRDAAAVRHLERANDRARGAFWARRIQSRDAGYAADWAHVALGRLGPGPRRLRWALATTMRETFGAIEWWRYSRACPTRQDRPLP